MVLILALFLLIGSWPLIFSFCLTVLVLTLASLSSHYILILLCLEANTLLLLSSLALFGKLASSEIFLFFFMFVLFVAEATLGLSTLISMSRMSGKEIMSNYFI